ncbi:DUF3592 domain-containing protein [Haloactinospora alba]|nr:DUF3592 domain-containing protein [Haloactinospora alba]
MAKLRATRKRLSPQASVLGVGLIVLLVGCVALFVGMTDYTDHTERVEATVEERDVDIERDSDGDRVGKDITVYVDYTVEQESYRDMQLYGLGTDDYHEGESLTVAYAPDEPEHVVTPRSTEPGAYDLAWYAGLVVVVVGVVITAVGGVMMRLRK